jgi:hypothetical protein
LPAQQALQGKPQGVICHKTGQPEFNPLSGLCWAVNNSLNPAMLLATFAIALLANDQVPSKAAEPRSYEIVRATVQILAAEEIRFDEQPRVAAAPQRQIRQYRLRDGMPLVEFF